MGDFYDKVRRAKTNSDKIALLTKWRGDQKLKLAVSPQPIFIKKGAAKTTKTNGRGSLEFIFCTAATLDREVAFTCLIDESKLTITRVRFGSVGTYGNCFWETSNHLARSLKIAEDRGLKVMLGHTHPEVYGPVCSNIYYWDDCPYGEDYFMMLWRMRRYPNLISRFHIIMTPLAEQIGIFEIKSGGRIVYHPLKYIE